MTPIVSKRFVTDTALSFDDVSLQPAFSTISPEQVDLNSLFSPCITLKRPFVATCTDSKTLVEMAIFMARQGGIAVIPHDMPVSRQADHVRKIKRFQSRVVRQVISVTPDMYVAEAMEYRQRHGITCLPVLDAETRKVIKVISLDDAFMALSPDAIIGELDMGDEPLTINENELEDAAKVLKNAHVPCLIVVDSKGQCVGLVSREDHENISQYQKATLDKQGSLCVAASVGIGEEHYDRVTALIEAGVDAIIVEAAHAHTKAATDIVTYIRRQRLGHVDVVGGNVMTTDAALALIDAGANALRVGSGSKLALNNLAPGVGLPQFAAILQVGEACAMHNTPVVAHGDIRSFSDGIKTFAAGATALVIDALLTDPQDLDRVALEIDALSQALCSALAYTGCATIKEFNTKAQFVPVTGR